LPKGLKTIVPRVVDLFVPTIQALQKLGGSASIEEIDETVADILKLPDESRAVLHNEGPRTKLQYRCAWARSWLKHAGLVTNSDRGVWALTSEGDAVRSTDFADLPRKVRQAVYAYRKNQESLATETVDEELESSSEPDWKEKLLDSITSISPTAFERLSQRILRESGFSQVQVTGKTGDGGIDGDLLPINAPSFG